MGGSAVVPVFEPLKAAFLAGEFEQFGDLATEKMKSLREDIAPSLRQIKGLFPNGFESCQTIVQRVETGGMVQEVTTFNIQNNDIPLALYLLAIPTRGEMIVVQFQFHTTLSQVFDELR